ncbi:IclR family transcriptional regulator [Roseobacter sp. N2S]|uniref:IclR family transcriptional regulator n=1 Tax=Roseobacter sp. N2S TaxID=2663844 RepID=UPI00285EB34F|nr:IclR family transcriptional regulator [Roseobacter sp. N2S]MDR6265839.1 DNA-binding IclR family transcriptional regulator [Roseobacter sp. N2S]
MSEKNYQLQTLSRALDVLAMIEVSAEPLNLTAIANRLGEAAPVVFRILKTLETKGYVRKDGSSKNYLPAEAHDRMKTARLLVRALHDLSNRPDRSIEDVASDLDADVHTTELVLRTMKDSGLTVVSAAGNWSLSPHLPAISRPQSTAELLEQVRPIMENLRGETEESTTLFVRNGGSQVALEVLSSHHPLRYTLEVGAVFPVTRGAAGKAALAWLPEPEITTILSDPALSGEDINPPMLLQTLRKVRLQGYAWSYGERIVGASAVALPILDRVGEVRAVLAITAPEFRTPEEKLHEYGALLRSQLSAAGLFVSDTQPEIVE